MKKEELIGLDITEVRQKLGYWWVLCEQFVNVGVPCWYRFERKGKGIIEVRTKDNIVIDIVGNYFNFFDVL